ncbi:MAG: hypothetical protein ACR2PA_22560 [Hyphomicrobiaceae bacterium]
MNGKGIFMVRAVVADPNNRDGFDTWYEKEHLPDALRIFSAKRAWRTWSRSDPSVHIAFYEFANVDAADAVQRSDGIKGMIAEFDRVWGDKVTRSREVLDVVGEIGG